MIFSGGLTNTMFPASSMRRGEWVDLKEGDDLEHDLAVEASGPVA
jgi:hypothetical protein